MNRSHHLSFLPQLCALVTLSACATQSPTAKSPPRIPAPTPASAQASVPAAAVTPPPAAMRRTEPKQDPNHPLHIGEEFYPFQSRRLQEEGTCVVRLQVDAQGHIRAAQLVSSTGYERLNKACLAAFVDVSLLPATLDGKPVAAWTLERITWKLEGRIFPLTPQIREDYELKIGAADYPAVSLKLRQEGDCTVHAEVARDGVPTTVTLIKSTFYAPLDQACLSAIQQAQFVAARQDGTPFTATTDINISWRLPAS